MNPPAGLSTLDCEDRPGIVAAQVLACGVQWTGTRRVFLNGIRAIVFR